MLRALGYLFGKNQHIKQTFFELVVPDEIKIYQTNKYNLRASWFIQYQKHVKNFAMLK